MGTALMIASCYGQEAIARLLLQKGADVEIKTKDGQTALDLARKCGRKSIVRMLQDNPPKFGLVDRVDALGLKTGAAANPNCSLLEKVGKLEEIVYGMTQSGSLKDRVAKLEEEL